MNDRHDNLDRRAFLRHSTILLLSSAAPIFSAGSEPTSGFNTNGQDKIPPGGEYFAHVYDKQRHLLLTVGAYDGGEYCWMGRKFVQDLSGLLGADFEVSLPDPFWTADMGGENPLLVGSIDCRVFVERDGYHLYFYTDPEETGYDDDDWIENEYGNYVPKNWYEFEFDTPNYALNAMPLGTNKTEQLAAVKFALKQAMLVSGRVDTHGPVAALVAIRHALATSEFGWEFFEDTF